MHQESEREIGEIERKRHKRRGSRSSTVDEKGRDTIKMKGEQKS